MRTGALIVCLSLALAGCAHVRPPPAAGCVIRAYPIRSELKDPVAAAAATPGVKFYDDVLKESLRKRASARLRGDPGSVLVLSGGSQNGAFGGGLLLGLPEPEVYDAVTGVSTGALHATLAFLAAQEVARDRPEPVDQGDGLYRMKRSNLEDLAVALSISRESTLLDVGQPGLVAAVTEGSIGSLAPLRRRLLGFASNDTLEAVGRQARQDRLLMVGVTSLDDGHGYALDLTELASRFLDRADPALRECYVDALVASSSVPLAAQPVTLRISVDGQRSQEHLFIDGGARFGVFLPTRPAAADGATQSPDVTMIVNGRLYGGPWHDDGAPVGRWTTLQLLERSVDVLTNQVYRFSVDDVARFARDNNGAFRMAYISNEGLAAYGTHPDDHSYQGLTCSEWRKLDDKKKPLEFHPKHMACLLDYGVQRGKSDPWNYKFNATEATR